MTFSRECEYAIKGMVALAAQPGCRPLKLAEIAAREGLPPSFLSKIFQKLLKHSLVQSHRGVQRGYTLTCSASAITLRQVLEAIEGPDLFHRCVFTHRRCSQEKPCLVSGLLETIQPQVRAAFDRTTLQDLVDIRRTA